MYTYVDIERRCVVKKPSFSKSAHHQSQSHPLKSHLLLCRPSHHSTTTCSCSLIRIPIHLCPSDRPRLGYDYTIDIIARPSQRGPILPPTALTYDTLRIKQAPEGSRMCFGEDEISHYILSTPITPRRARGLAFPRTGSKADFRRRVASKRCLNSEDKLRRYSLASPKAP